MNKSKTSEKTLGVKAAAIGGIALLALGGFAGANLFPRVETVTQTVTVDKPVEVIKEVEVVKTVYEEVPVEVIKEVVTNNAEYDAMLRVLTDLDGKVDMVTDDLEDLDVAEVSDRFVFAADALAIAGNEVREQGMDELHNEVVALIGGGTITLDEDDMGRFRLDDEPGFVSFTSYDFDEKDAKVLVHASVRQDSKTFDVEFEVIIRDGKYRSMDVVSIAQRP
jgi:hypothetical protein